MTRDPWDSEQDRTDAQVWLWRALSEIRVARQFDLDLAGPGLDALQRQVQVVLDDLNDDAQWAAYDNGTARLIWHARVSVACRTIRAMQGQFGDTFDRLQDVVHSNVWRAWNTGPIPLPIAAEQSGDND